MPVTVNFIGSVDDSSVINLQNAIEANRQAIDSLVLNISSIGGNTTSGIAAYNYLKSLPFPIRTHNLGEVSSAAILIYLAGAERTAESISKFVMHPIEVSLNGTFSYFKLDEVISNLNADIRNYAKIVETEAPKLKEDNKVVDLLKNKGLVFSVEEAKLFGIVTG